MGYTHYWRPSRNILPGEWSAIVTAFKQIMANLPNAVEGQPLLIRGPFGTGEPEITKDKIAFNGDEQSNLDHEAMLFDRKLPPKDAPGNPPFCKTARKPYDLLVCALLMVAENEAPGALKVSSDGGLDYDEWGRAINLVRSVLAPDYPMPSFLRPDGQKGAATVPKRVADVLRQYANLELPFTY